MKCDLKVYGLQVLSDGNEFLGLENLVLDPNIDALSASEPKLVIAEIIWRRPS